MTYTVTANTEDGAVEYTMSSRADSINMAQELADESGSSNVFISFYRRKDSEIVYINRDGYNITGQSWA